jgi:hypothetical protein
MMTMLVAPSGTAFHTQRRGEAGVIDLGLGQAFGATEIGALDAGDGASCAG